MKMRADGVNVALSHAHLVHRQREHIPDRVRFGYVHEDLVRNGEWP
jgi:hypothetical protein